MSTVDSTHAVEEITVQVTVGMRIRSYGVYRARAPTLRYGCTKTRIGEIRNGKWGNAEMRKWGVEDKSVAARGSAVTHKQWQRQRIGEGKCACQANPSRAQLELTYTAPNHFRSRFYSCSLA